MKSLIPQKVKKILADLLGITAINKRIDQLEQLLLESKDEVWERSRTRWRQSNPTTSLTWEREVTGDNFISRVSSYGVFGPEKAILEIGPGYGRLLKACLEQGISFKKYTGVDLSLDNVKYLRENFPREDVHIIQSDVEKVTFDEKFDVILSSLTFKHLFPSFEKALRNVVNYVNPGGMFFFDLLEGRGRSFEDDGVTYVRWYTRLEILELLRDVSLEHVAFDQVEHDLEHSRLLVVARKPE
jgi:SAM-dependent methyltransferase